MTETASPRLQRAKIVAAVVAGVAALLMGFHVLDLLHQRVADEAALVASVTASAAGPAASVGPSAPRPAPSVPATAAPSIPTGGATGSASAAVVHAIYRTRASLRLAQATHGFDGTLRLLEDARARTRDDTRTEPMRVTEGFLHGRLELLDAGGRPVDAFELWTVLAEVREMGFAGAPRGAFFVELNPECFASSFCGKDTEIVDVSAGKLAWVSSVDAETRKAEPIALRDSVMSGWRPSPAAPGRPPEIFAVVSNQTVTAYVRYTLEDRAWVKRYKQRIGPDPPGNPGNEEAAFDLAKFPARPGGGR